MKLILTTLSLFIFPLLTVHAEQIASFERANTFYSQGIYDSAIVYYEKILSPDKQSFEVFFNLGNAFYKSGNLGKSILYYEKASLLDPSNEDLLFNLEMANLRIKDRIEPLPLNLFSRGSASVIRLASASAWAIAAIVCLWISFLSFAGYLLSLRMRWRRRGFYMMIVTFSAALILLILALARDRNDAQNQYAVITAPSAIIKSEPNESSMDLYLLHQGLKLKVLDKAGDWNRVRLADGNIGWMLTSKIEEI